MKKTTAIIFLLTILIPRAGIAQELETGSKAPNLLGRTLDKKLFSLNKIGTKPKLINFFWVSYVPCRDELPVMAELETVSDYVRNELTHIVFGEKIYWSTFFTMRCYS